MTKNHGVPRLARGAANVGAMLLAVIVVASLAGCYSMRRSSGGGQTGFTPPRQVNAADIALPAGYRIEAVATDLTFPTGVTFDSQGRAYVVEAGYCYGEVWTTPKLLRIEAGGRKTQVAAGNTNGPWNGVAFHDGAFYVAEGGALGGGRVLRIDAEGKVTVIVSNLPSMGDHHSNGPVIGPDGTLYFGQGTASNSGVIGEDNAQFGWLHRYPKFHDVPGQDIELAGRNFRSRNPLTNAQGAEAFTGAFTPFGGRTQRGQVVQGNVLCSGGVLRMRPDGSSLELVAWGFRNPFGLGFSPDGRLFVADNGYDDRGSRPVWGTPDVLWEVRKGVWYGWPDFSAGMALTNRWFKPPGKEQLQFLLAKHPNTPPKPAAFFGVHASANGLDFSRSPSFGHVGQAFVALFGDQAPAVGKVLQPVGFQVVRVETGTGVIETFAVNKGRTVGPASLIESGGLERPVAVKFNPAGDALYVVDFGVLTQTKKKSHPRKGTGVLWRIVREGR
jgi:glucose/arabinose dehydrogenase